MENRPRRAGLWPSQDSSLTILGPNTEFTGTLKSQGDVRLEDIFTGTIIARGQVEIGQNATLDGDLYCEAVTVAGLVRGNLSATTISITDTGRVLGNLQSEKLITEDEAFIEGTVTLLETFDLKAAIAGLGGPADERFIPDTEDE
ncbi:MAG: polymer-forming cytoskeletal protein [Anaerolineae bacterium]|nr:polymer-forming cytoskeletal protein [Anaerolineae bacterium]